MEEREVEIATVRLASKPENPDGTTTEFKPKSRWWMCGAKGRGIIRSKYFRQVGYTCMFC